MYIDMSTFKTSDLQWLLLLSSHREVILACSTYRRVVTEEAWLCIQTCDQSAVSMSGESNWGNLDKESLDLQLQSCKSHEFQFLDSSTSGSQLHDHSPSKLSAIRYICWKTFQGRVVQNWAYCGSYDSRGGRHFQSWHCNKKWRRFHLLPR